METGSVQRIPGGTASVVETTASLEESPQRSGVGTGQPGTTTGSVEVRRFPPAVESSGKKCRCRR